MQVTLNLPDDISAALEGQWRDLPKHALEALAVEGYRTGALTEAQVRRLLGLESRFQVHALLKEHRVPLRYSEADVEDDLAAHRELGILREE
ncbi:MAG: UPF0175 family protein [Thermoanaerobaculia bacterium]